MKMKEIKWRKYQIYALYGGENSDTYLTQGTMQDIADYLGVDIETVRFYSTPSHWKRPHRYEVVKIKGEYDVR